MPNHSFEIYDTCPNSGGQIRYAFPWVDPTGSSSDYFNSCSGLSSLGVPTNNGGNQIAKDGNAYAGFVAYANFILNAREYIEVKLTDTLKANSCYRLIFYVSIGDGELYGVNTLSAYFSDTAISGPVYTFFPFNPQFIYTDTLLIGDDTTWYKVEGTFTASGGEQYMTIGNFKHDANTLITLVNPLGGQGIAYYYIDDISLTKCSGIGIDEMENEEHVKLYPNPNDGTMTLEYRISDLETGVLTFYDVTGKVMKREGFTGSATSLKIDASMMDAGAYYYEIMVGDKKMKVEKLIIIK